LTAREPSQIYASFGFDPPLTPDERHPRRATSTHEDEGAESTALPPTCTCTSDKDKRPKHRPSPPPHTALRACAPHTKHLNHGGLPLSLSLAAMWVRDDAATRRPREHSHPPGRQICAPRTLRSPRSHRQSSTSLLRTTACSSPHLHPRPSIHFWASCALHPQSTRPSLTRTPHVTHSHGTARAQA